MAGDRDRSIELVSSVRTDEICEWYAEHGKMAGYHRFRQLNLPEPARTNIVIDKTRLSAKLERTVFERDGYRCRYCNARLVSRFVIKEFAKLLDFPGFKKGNRDVDTHGVYILLETVADHVVPRSLGGRTDTGNLVTSCNPCNIGKSSYTVDQMAIQNPFSRPPVVDSWDGLAPYLERLRSLAA